MERQLIFPRENPNPMSKYIKSLLFIVLETASLNVIFSVLAAWLGGVGGFSLKKITQGVTDAVITIAYQNSRFFTWSRVSAEKSLSTKKLGNKNPINVPIVLISAKRAVASGLFIFNF